MSVLKVITRKLFPAMYNSVIFFFEFFHRGEKRFLIFFSKNNQNIKKRIIHKNMPCLKIQIQRCYLLKLTLSNNVNRLASAQSTAWHRKWVDNNKTSVNSINDFQFTNEVKSKLQIFEILAGNNSMIVQQSVFGCTIV